MASTTPRAGRLPQSHEAPHPRSHPDVALRPQAPVDDAFLHELYAATREHELSLTGWDEPSKASFLAMQFEAQRRYYLEQFPGARYEIVLRRGRPVGRLIVDRGARTMTILDIAVVGEHRGQGIGTALLTALIDEADRLGLAVRMHVERDNPAIRLYHRLGLRTTDEAGVYFQLERPAQPPSGPPAQGDTNGDPVPR